MDFGLARTDGSAWLHREGNVWKLKTWPRNRNFTLEFSRDRFEQPVQVDCVGGTANQVAPVPAGSRWRLPLNGATEYRWTNAPPRLSISASNHAVIVSWPASAAGATLESTADLSAPATWSPVANSAASQSAVLPATGTRQFQRLRLP